MIGAEGGWRISLVICVMQVMKAPSRIRIGLQQGCALAAFVTAGGAEGFAHANQEPSPAVSFVCSALQARSSQHSLSTGCSGCHVLRSDSAVLRLCNIHMPSQHRPAWTRRQHDMDRGCRRRSLNDRM